MSLRTAAYRLALKGMFTLRPERIHGVIHDGLGLLQAVGPANRILSKVVPVSDPVLAQEVFGRTIPRPLGLAAGFDKNATAADTWTSVGFGYSELGTVTASPQPGNPTPRLFRLPADKAILNRMGFNNDGAAAVPARLARLRARRAGQRAVVGVNIGKSRATPVEDAAQDYATSARLLAPYADFLVVNVSSPNTPGLRGLQAVETLAPLLRAVKAAAGTTPLLVKIAPDLPDDEIEAISRRSRQCAVRCSRPTTQLIAQGPSCSSEE